MELFLIEKIETVRLQMVKEALVQDSLTHESVVAISHKLDRYIAIYQKQKKKTVVRVIKQHEQLVVAQ
ncbi:aspartyl-phosphate phosphatase Spo0E family protein [Paenibacillus macquariensis]|uniref:Spo0E like sporulation regulatory protein n=1 Tax=Paenibacillus macquariensis TaxID=948756 RepID=A0ABY1KFS0_9BACL|nr:aspartyl-phosphate phosphatase Spo0E family protein [Paenibacillus macquariensis]MEC0094407.1 aspartyl-phosphate phosphatase Spo0E family protein [Paenibacillus macquariensis]OAB24994.1 hypothetical protein PMSM_28590 [Paenibacillus macquariensis subsp. macquariensis]SIR65369.1 Spo0E like sporulation regulatory protein [Paenibacillus macquariensis]